MNVAKGVDEIVNEEDSSQDRISQDRIGGRGGRSQDTT